MNKKKNWKSTSSCEKVLVEDVEEWPIQLLRTLDVFSDCGGLSKGLCEAVVADVQWAIVNVKTAVEAFKMNNPPGCVVFNEDCNLLLRRLIDGDTTDINGQQLPQKGELDLLCGRPPCTWVSAPNLAHIMIH